MNKSARHRPHRSGDGIQPRETSYPYDLNHNALVPQKRPSRQAARCDSLSALFSRFYL